MTVRCRILNVWGEQGESIESGDLNPRRRINIGRPALQNYITRVTGHIPNSSRLSDLTIRYDFFKNGEKFESNHIVPSDFDDFYFDGNMRITYTYSVEEFDNLYNTITITAEPGIKIRTVHELRLYFETTLGFEFDQFAIDLFRDSYNNPPSIECINVDTEEVTVRVVGNPFEDTNVEVTYSNPPVGYATEEFVTNKIQFLLDELNRLYGLNEELATENAAILRERSSLQEAIRSLNAAYLNCIQNT